MWKGQHLLLTKEGAWSHAPASVEVQLMMHLCAILQEYQAIFEHFARRLAKHEYDIIVGGKCRLTLLAGAIYTQEELVKGKQATSSLCLFCQAEDETVEHILWICRKWTSNRVALLLL